MRIPRPSTPLRSGLSLIECLVYIAVLGVLLSVGGLTAAKAWDAHRALSRNANDIHRAMNAGERWRQEVRHAIRPIEFNSTHSHALCRITTASGLVEYQVADGTLQRREGEHGAWLNVLPRVRTSEMSVTNLHGVSACRWELAMEPAHKRARLQPLFTFTAVPTEATR